MTSTPPAPDSPDQSLGTGNEDSTARDAQIRSENAFADGIAQAARSKGLDQLLDTDGPRSAALLKAMGGVRGILEAVLPGIAFLILFTITSNLILSVAVPVAVGLVALVIRLVQKSQVTPVIGGLVGMIISAFLALRSGEGRGYYELGFWTNGAYGAGILVTVLIGWPLIGLIAGALLGDGVSWRKDRRKFRFFQWLTLAWVAFFAVRLAVQIPLYLANDVVALGLTRLIMGPPLYGVLLVVTWLLVKALYATKSPSPPDETTPIS